MSAIEQVISDTGTVNAQVTYHTRVPGRSVVHQGAPGQESKHVGDAKFDDLTMPISDARPITGQPTLDTQGFELHTRPTAVRDFYDVTLMSTHSVESSVPSTMSHLTTFWVWEGLIPHEVSRSLTEQASTGSHDVQPTCRTEISC